MKLYDLPRRQENRPRIYGLNPDGHEDGWVEFDHLDGMYSFCLAFDGDGNKLGICHIAGSTPLQPHLDGWRIPDQENS
ncbi:hypothetical protein JRC04_05550 [Mycolicibacterium sp. S2-37]|uniref:hypothetical protein n=1 Tax=Mycolicibacterium sp. S2-37 TaxID=2810297 RepID=UPI001A948085|nr:hypothetical protein [Mycolicibacterium sp. S2-37]MBO0676921.1 hypothetical protein [Mycolicibacterium sp. S2-37]